ncbi:MAG: hypothetical protein JSS87_09130 [Acidobacteria bacterium]|nr:hypothetical protein [Acidobacteriota bacterium]
MNRRDFGKLTTVAAMSAMTRAGEAQDNPEDWKSGQDSPVHDSDRLLPIGGHTVALENADVRIGFDVATGALVDFLLKPTGWQLVKDPKLAESFRVFAATTDRSYNPALGARNRAASVTKSPDGNSVTIVWDGLETEYSGRLDIVLTGVVTLDGSNVNFDLSLKNGSPKNTVTSAEWPIIGGFSVPENSSTFRKSAFNVPTSGREKNVYPRMEDDFGFCSVSFPGQLAAGRFNLFLAETHGLYIGRHDCEHTDMVRFALDLKPGYVSTRNFRVPQTKEIGGHPVRFVHSIQHFPFAAPGESYTCARITMAGFKGSWHKGVDIYRKWFATWFKRGSQPEWLNHPHMWTQIQINSSEDDLRTMYKDLPRRALDAAKNGIKVIQLTGWNDGGQDRNNPSHDTDPRLGTHEDLKQAIARIEKMGIRLVLFNKYCWADQTTDWYKRELYKYMATDPNGLIYTGDGYKYQTPEQLANINTRRFGVACVTDKRWLELSAREFQKSLDLGASGMLYDENHHHGTWDLCFSKDHGHHSPASLWLGDQQMGQMFRDQIKKSRGSDGAFLMAGEAMLDFQCQWYSVSYIRLVGEHVPMARYADPRREIMIAVSGFDDRDMVNCALRYRYIMSIEPFYFKGNASDAPLTVGYANKAEALRTKYRQYLWDGEFRDTQHAEVLVGDKPYREFAIFIGANGKRAAVVMNAGRRPIAATVKFEGTQLPLVCASPEQMDAKPVQGSVEIPAESIAVVMEA